MGKSFAIIGGDMRMIYLAKLLEKDNSVITFGQELNENNLLKAKNLENSIKIAELIVCPIPFSKDGENVYTEFSESKIKIKELMQLCCEKTILAGAISKEMYKKAEENSVKLIDIMKNESLTVLNTIATAEGAVEVAIRKTNFTIHGSKVLILGFGRVAKIVAEKFDGLSADVTCSARKPEVFAWIEAYGYKHIKINELEKSIKEYDIIVNTVPTLILDKEKLRMIKENCLVIDLASKPGGVDMKAINELKINFEWALSLPGKVAPKTSAEYIMRVLEV